MKILSIETSCDETSVSIIEGLVPLKTNRSKFYPVSILANIVSSQVKIHAKWGGVVPNLAAREHLKNIIPVLDKSLEEAKISLDDIDAFAVTRGPGLIPALLIGANAAKTLSYYYRKPLLGIHHIEGHIYANFILDEVGTKPKLQISNPKKVQVSNEQNLKLSPKNNLPIANRNSQITNLKFPILCLVVSGGHTQLVLMKKHLDYQVIGQTLDDAAGEAFDKVAKILELGYPGGPIVSAFAKKFRELNITTFELDSKFEILNSKFAFPRPMLNSKNLDFSFSGLKTSVLYFYRKAQEKIKNEKDLSLLKKMICKEFEDAAIEVLVKKSIRAAKQYRPESFLLAGGVAANSRLSNELSQALGKELPEISFSSPSTEFCGDNAAMIGIAAFYRMIFLKNKNQSLGNWKTLEPDPNMKLE